MTDDEGLVDKDGNVDEDELDRRIREMGLDQTPSIDEAKKKADGIDSEFDERLKNLENKARTHKLIRDNQQRETTRKLEGDRDSAKGLGVGLSIAYTIIGLPFLGVLIGWILDERTGGGQTYKSLGVLIGAVLGIVMAFVMLARANRQG